jgi:adenylate cyclase
MRVITTGAVVVLVVLGVFLVRPAPVANLDDKVCDMLTGWAGPGRPSNEVVIVEIDEKSLSKFGRWPWPRNLLGELSRDILDHGAAALVLDMMFPQEDRGNDEVLATALTGKPVVVGYTLRFDGGGTSLALCPAPPLPLALASANGSAGTALFHATGAVCRGSCKIQSGEAPTTRTTLVWCFVSAPKMPSMFATAPTNGVHHRWRSIAPPCLLFALFK